MARSERTHPDKNQYANPLTEQGQEEIRNHHFRNPGVTKVETESTETADKPVRFVVHYESEHSMHHVSIGTTLAMKTHSGFIPLSTEVDEEELTASVELAKAVATIRDEETGEAYAVSRIVNEEDEQLLRSVQTEGQLPRFTAD